MKRLKTMEHLERAHHELVEAVASIPTAAELDPLVRLVMAADKAVGEARKLLGERAHAKARRSAA